MSAFLSRNGLWPMPGRRCCPVAMEVCPRVFFRSTVARMIVWSAVAFLGIGTAYPHDPKRPELNAWFKSLKNKAGEACCDSGDGQHAEAEAVLRHRWRYDPHVALLHSGIRWMIITVILVTIHVRDGSFATGAIQRQVQPCPL